MALLEEPYRWLPFDARAIRAMKDRFAGHRCFVLGNGPSLNRADLTKLTDEYSFAVNGIFYKTDESGYRPTFYVVEDRHVIEDNLDRIAAYEAPYKFFPSQYRSLLGRQQNTYYFNANRGFYEPKSPSFGIPRFSSDCARRIFFGQSVTIVNLQLAFYLGFSQVYMIGMDFSYKIPTSAVVEGNDITSTEDDTNHFHPDYFGRGKRWHDPELDRVLVNYEHAKRIFADDGRTIYNATHGGKLEVFERVDFDELF